MGKIIMSFSINDWYSKVVMPGRIRSAIRNYLSLDWTIDSIKDSLIWGISKKQLQEIVNGDEFKEYIITDHYKELIKRFEEENLL